MVVSFNWEKVVIGNNLAAVIHAYENGWPIIFNSEPQFFMFDRLEDGNLKHVLWQDITSKISIAGLNPFGNKATSLRIKDDNIEVICTNKKYNVHYKNIIFFDDKNIDNFPFKKIEIEKLKICDWYRVTSGTNHEHWIIEDDNDFAGTIYFHPKVTLPKYKDCVVQSFIPAQTLEDVNHTPAMVRLKTIDMMTKAGIKGTKHTKTYYYPIKMKFLERQVFEIKEEFRQEKDNYILDTREFK